MGLESAEEAVCSWADGEDAEEQEGLIVQGMGWETEFESEVDRSEGGF